MNYEGVFEIIKRIISLWVLVVPIIPNTINFFPKKNLFAIKDEQYYNEHIRNYRKSYFIPVVTAFAIIYLHPFEILSQDKYIYSSTVITFFIIMFIYNTKVDIKKIKEYIRKEYIMYPACLMITSVRIFDSKKVMYGSFFIFLICVVIFVYNLNELYNISIKKLEKIKITYKNKNSDENIIFYKQQKEETILYIRDNDEIKVKTIKNDQIVEKIEIYK